MASKVRKAKPGGVVRPRSAKQSTPNSSSAPPPSPVKSERRVHIAITALVLALMAIGFQLRLDRAKGTFLNPDECLNYSMASKPSLSQVFTDSTMDTHPPLYKSTLYGWLKFGRSEVYLRLLSVIFGTLLVWPLFSWVRGALGLLPGFVAAAIVAVSPSLIDMSAEVRDYSMLLVLAAAAFWTLDRAFADRSPRWMAAHAAFLCLAILTTYGMLWVAVATGVYGALLVWRERKNYRMAAAWVGSQLGAGVVCTILYFVHIRYVEGFYNLAAPEFGYLHPLYFNSKTESAWGFLVRGTRGCFAYLFGRQWVADTALVMFLIGVVLMAVEGWRQGDRRKLSLALILPLGPLVTWIASLLHLYPFGNSRHSIYLVIFFVPAIAYCFVRALDGLAYVFTLERSPSATPGRTGLVVAASLVLVFAWNATAITYEPLFQPEQQAIGHMDDAMRYLRQQVPKDAVLVMSGQSETMMEYYLGGRCGPSVPIGEGIYHGCMGDHETVFLLRWGIPLNDFLGVIRTASQTLHWAPDKPVWVIDAGWGVNMSNLLQTFYPELPLTGSRFGSAISLFRVPVDSAQTLQLKESVSVMR